MDKNLKETIIAEYSKVWDDKMVKYCVGKVSDAVELECGLIYIFEKPKIEKNFCFGFRLNAHDTEEYDDANNMVAHVQNDNGEYFRNYNLRNFDNFAELLERTEGMFAEVTYQGRCKICGIHDYKGRSHIFPMPKNPIMLTKTDIENIKKVNESERVKFEKRLNVYWKRYGNSQIRSWSYWVDE